MRSTAGRRRGRACAWAVLALGIGVAGSPSTGFGEEEERLHPTRERPAVAPGVARVLALEGDPVAGRAAYESCAVCHLPNGHGRPDGTFPQIAGQHREVIVKQLVDIREGRRSNPVMAPYAEALIDDQELADVAAYIETLPAPAPAPAPSAEAGAADASGEALYERDCSACHGARGEGDPARFVPVLAGQHEAYLLRQIRAIAAGRRGNAHPVMQRSVAGYDDAALQAAVRHAAGLPGPRRARDD